MVIFCVDHSLFDGKLTIWMGTLPNCALSTGRCCRRSRREDFTVESIRDFRSVVDDHQQNRGQSFALADVKSVTIESPAELA